MTEAEWLISDNPLAMLAAITRRPQQAAATNRPNRMAPTEGQLRAWVEACRNGTDDGSWGNYDLTTESGLGGAVYYWARPTFPDAHLSLADRAHLLREVLGNPFRPVAVSPAVYIPHLGALDFSSAERWLTPAILSLARLARDNPVRPPLAPGQRYRSQVMAARNSVVGCCNDHANNTWCDCLARAVSDVPCIDPFRLAVLADALEEAGCGSADLLGHLRSDGPHIGACWALALILGED